MRAAICFGWTMLVVAGTLGADTVTDPPAEVLPAEVRLLTRLSSRRSKPGDEVKGVVTAPVPSPQGGMIPGGTIVQGKVREVKGVGLGIRREKARLSLELTELQLPGGRTVPLRSRLLAVDNARERVDSKGDIRGIRATATISHRLGFRAASLAWNNPVTMFPLLVVQSLLLRFPDPEIEYSPGTDLHIEIHETGLLEGIEPPAPAAPALTAEDRAELETVTTATPYWSYCRRSGAPMDIVNLVFIGSRQAVERAFDAAGWNGSRPNSAGAGLGAFQAIAERKAYPDAPMRTLLVDGAKPEMTWQKSLNTFEKRHHLRVWRSGEWRGQTVWLAAATHDTGVSFSLRFGPTHRVDPEVDKEREKVVRDLRFTGCVDAVTHAARPPDLRTTSGPDRKELRTDGAVAVLLLNACEPSLTGVEVAQSNEEPGTLVRLIRRLTLTTRNYFLRDNLPWRIGEAGHLSFRALRNWRQRRASERDAIEARQKPPAADGSAAVAN